MLKLEINEEKKGWSKKDIEGICLMVAVFKEVIYWEKKIVNLNKINVLCFNL